MRKNVKNTLIIASLYILFANQGHAFDIDMTVDDEIRKNYNPNQLINDVGKKDSALEKNMQAEPIYTNSDSNLPDLPSIVDKIQADTQKSVKQAYTKYTGGNIKVKARTSFNVVSLADISDMQRKGANVKFKTKGNTFGKNYTIPAGTEFQGYIIDSHRPQITCNGGLVAIRIDSMIYKNQKIPIVAYVTRANDKKIFFNKIKGKRTYLKTMWKNGNWGRVIFDKMLTTSVGLSKDKTTLVLMPFPLAYGTICLGANSILSPITAFFSKGEHISIPAGSNFRIKLLDEVMIN